MRLRYPLIVIIFCGVLAFTFSPTFIQEGEAGSDQYFSESFYDNFDLVNFSVIEESKFISRPNRVEEVDGKAAVVYGKDGRLNSGLVYDSELYGHSYRSIGSIVELDGGIAFKALNGTKPVVVKEGKLITPDFDRVYSLISLGNEIAFIGQEKDEESGGTVVVGNRKKSLHPSGYLSEVGGKVAYTTGDDFSNQSLVLGNTTIGPFYDIGGVTNEILEKNDRPLYKTRGRKGNSSQTNQNYVYWGNEVLEGPYPDITDLEVIDGKAAFIFNEKPEYSYNQGENNLYYGGQILGKNYSIILGFKEVGNSIAYRTGETIVFNKEKYAEDFDTITGFGEVDGKLYVKGEKGGEEIILYEKQLYGSNCTKIKDPFLLGEEFAFICEREGDWFIESSNNKIGPFTEIAYEETIGRKDYFIGRPVITGERTSGQIYEEVFVES